MPLINFPLLCSCGDGCVTSFEYIWEGKMGGKQIMHQEKEWKTFAYLGFLNHLLCLKRIM